MDALIRSITDLFANNARYVVPAYQRPYVWTEDDQWMPLWEDVARVADNRLEGESDGHFLGAVVIRLEDAPPGGVTQWSVIDGQQRLTTLQILISAMASVAESDGLDREARRLRRLNLLPDDDADGDDRFKFWPTNINRRAFREVIADRTRQADDDPDTTIHEAWAFFAARVADYVHTESAGEDNVPQRHRALIEGVTGLLQVVTISLASNDPAQVIFETLNARGTPLLAMDLVKNVLFEGQRERGSPRTRPTTNSGPAASATTSTGERSNASAVSRSLGLRRSSCIGWPRASARSFLETGCSSCSGVEFSQALRVSTCCEPSTTTPPSGADSSTSHRKTRHTASSEP